MKSIVAVPARLESSRLPNKVIADIGGKPMLQRVLEACAKAQSPVSVVLCTDCEDLLKCAKAWGFEAILTSSSCSSGSARIASVADKLIALVGDAPHQVAILNVQADQPFIDPKVIDQMAAEFNQRSPSPEVLTPIYPMKTEDIHNPNVVKSLLAANGRAIYFSRSAIPHVRDVDRKHWYLYAKYWGHVGIYGYRADVLQRWLSLPLSPLEKVEKLEQLRLIENNIAVDTFPVTGEFLSIDTPEQLTLAQRMVS